MSKLDDVIKLWISINNENKIFICERLFIKSFICPRNKFKLNELLQNLRIMILMYLNSNLVIIE